MVTKEEAKTKIIESLEKAREMHQAKVDAGKHMLVAENCIVVVNDVYTVGVKEDGTAELRGLAEPEMHWTESRANEVAVIVRKNIKAGKTPVVTVERWQVYHRQKVAEITKLIESFS